ncbi:MAG: hypothetical protein AAF846_08795 [Chloroflexota bacterium]
MAYQLTWHIEKQALLLTLSQQYSTQDAAKANKEISDILEQSTEKISLLIDATTMERPHNFSEIRSTQKYMDNFYLKSIYVAASDRLVKLSMMVIFNLSRAALFVCDDFDKADYMLRKHLENTTRIPHTLADD